MMTLLCFMVLGGMTLQITAMFDELYTLDSSTRVNDIAVARVLGSLEKILIGLDNNETDLWDTTSNMTPVMEGSSSTPSLLLSLPGINSVDWSPFDSVKYVTANEVNATIWDATDPMMQTDTVLLVEPSSCAMYKSDGTMIVAAFDNNLARSFTDAGTAVASVDHGEPVDTCRFIDQGMFADSVVSTSSTKVIVWNPMDGTVLRTLARLNVLTSLSDNATFSFLQGCNDPLICGVDLISGWSSTATTDGTLELAKEDITMPANNTTVTKADSNLTVGHATALLNRIDGCPSASPTLGAVYVGFADGTVGVKTSCDVLPSGSTTFTQTFTAHSGAKLTWISTTTSGNSGFLATTADDGSAKIWPIKADGTIDTAAVQVITPPADIITERVAVRAKWFEREAVEKKKLAIAYSGKDSLAVAIGRTKILQQP